MKTTNAMTVNENGNVNVKSLKNSDNMEKQQETQTGTLSENEVLENARKILMEKRKYLSDNADADTNIIKAAKTNVVKAEKDYAVALHDVKLPTIPVEFWQVEESTEEKEVISKRKEDIIIAVSDYNMTVTKVNVELGKDLIDNDKFEYVPDFVKLAEAYGAKAMRITKVEDIEKGFQLADTFKDGPTLLEFIIPTELNVLPMVPAGKSLSDMLLKDKK